MLFVSGCAEEAPEEAGEIEEAAEEAAGEVAEEAEEVVGEVEEEVAPEEMNIVETAVAAGNFNTLVAAVQAAGLEETLSEGGPFTVFAPTDEAFDALPEGTVEGLLEDPDALANILLYHVAEGEVMAADVVGMESIVTLQGSELPVDITDGVMVGDANVTATDIEASNGVIHVIDKVLIPPE